METIEERYENGVLKPIRRTNSANLTVFQEDFARLDELSARAKRVVGEASKEEITEILDEIWI